MPFDIVASTPSLYLKGLDQNTSSREFSHSLNASTSRRQGCSWADEVNSDSGGAAVLALSPAQRLGNKISTRGRGARDDGTVIDICASERNMVDRSRAICCTAANAWAPPPLNSRLSIPGAGDVETPAVFGRQARRQAHKWNYMLSEVRPHELFTAIWTMMEAESSGPRSLLLVVPCMQLNRSI